jgi:hypothetical protein
MAGENALSIPNSRRTERWGQGFEGFTTVEVVGVYYAKGGVQVVPGAEQGMGGSPRLGSSQGANPLGKVLVNPNIQFLKG